MGRSRKKNKVQVTAGKLNQRGGRAEERELSAAERRKLTALLWLGLSYLGA